jgi:hypothetical protein
MALSGAGQVFWQGQKAGEGIPRSPSSFCQFFGRGMDGPGLRRLEYGVAYTPRLRHPTTIMPIGAGHAVVESGDAAAILKATDAAPAQGAKKRWALREPVALPLVSLTICHRCRGAQEICRGQRPALPSLAVGCAITRGNSREPVSNLLRPCSGWPIIIRLPAQVPEVVASEYRDCDCNNDHDHRHASATFVRFVWHRPLHFPYADWNGSEGPLFPGISTGGSGEDSFRDPARRSQRLTVQRTSSPFIG